MTAQEIRGKIATMEKTLANPSTPEEITPNIKEALKNAKAKLAELEEVDTPTPKKVLKKDFYAAMTPKYQGLTQAYFSSLRQKEYEAKLAKLEQAAVEMGVEAAKAEDYAYSFIFVHLPKGEKSKKKPEAKAPVAKSTPEKPSDTPKSVLKSAFSWKNKVSVANLQPIVMHCQHYIKKIDAPTLVSLKGTGSASIQVQAQAGEYLIFDDKGYPVFIMNPTSFTKKCNEGTTVDQHKELKHKEEENKALQKQIQELEKQLSSGRQSITGLEQANTGLQSKIQELESDLEKVTKELDQLKAEAKEQEPKPQPRTASKPKLKPTKPVQASNKNPKPRAKRAVCSLDEAETGRRVSKVIKFFLDEAERWNKSQSSRKITKVMRTKGDKQEIILEVADYAGLSGLTTFLGNRKYYRLCVDSFKLDTGDAPARGSYAVVVKEARMKQVYTTKGEKQYTICLKSYRELLKCSFEGTCTTAQSDKWKKLYKECGDLVQKLEKQPKALKLFHAEVKQRRRNGELYSDAMARVAGEIKASL